MRKMLYNICLFVFLSMAISCLNKVKVRDDLKKDLESLSPNTILGVFENKIGKLHIYNLPAYKDSLIPIGSTADIFLSLVAIEEGSIEDAKSTINVNGGDVSLQKAFRNNDTNFFKALLLSKMNESYLRDKMDTLHYGKAFVGKKDIYHKLFITTDEQLGLVKKIYFNQLPFQDRTINIVKSLFNYNAYKGNDWYWKISKKIIQDNKMNYWVVGWVDNKKNVSFFAFNTSLSDKNNRFNDTFSLVQFTEQIVSKTLE